MSKAITISGSTYTVTGTIVDQATDEGAVDLHIIAYDDDTGKDDFLGIGVTDANGVFSISFDKSKFKRNIGIDSFERRPDLYFKVRDAGFELLNTKDNPIKDADESSPPISFTVSLKDSKLRKLINKKPAAEPKWLGGFAESNGNFAYPKPNLTSLDMQDNLDNIDKLERQQKVVWPEFSWLSVPGDKDSRCYQMFAPDISRLGYTTKGEVFAIICPQQGHCSPLLGCMNVEVTVTGNRGWANEDNRTLAADMTVLGKIWFSPSKRPITKKIWKHFQENKLQFPHNKENAIIIETFNPSKPDEPIFPLTKGLSDQPEIRNKFDYFDFPIPNFARHDGLAWTNGHLGVLIGDVRSTGNDKVDKFNRLVVDLFNTAAGNMLKKGGVLTWNVWFTAPEKVETDEWQDHADLWRESINADHGSPEGPGTVARRFDGSPFKPLKAHFKEDLQKVMGFSNEHLKAILGDLVDDLKADLADDLKSSLEGLLS